MRKSLFFLCIFSMLASYGGQRPKLCAAIRGNGELVFAHWSSLARIVEHYGPIDAMAGGSSAAISLFLYESIEKNPYLSCPRKQPSCMQTRSLEIAFLLKSLQGYFDYWVTTEDVQAAGTLLKATPEIINRLKFWARDTQNDLEGKEVDEISLWKLIGSVRKSVQTLLHSPGVKSIVNEETKKYIRNGFDHLESIPFYRLKKKLEAMKLIKFRLLEVVRSVKLIAAGGFNAKDDERLFFRPGIISFENVAVKFGRVADFYAGYFYAGKPSFYAKPVVERFGGEMKSILKNCAKRAEGKSWSEISTSGCARKFKELVKLHLNRLLADEQSDIPRKYRVDDMPGKGFFPSTAVLNRSESIRYQMTYQQYWKTTDKNFGMDYSIPFDSLMFGYWGELNDLIMVKKNLTQNYPQDLKSQKMRALKNTSWKTILAVSPAEPGLSRLKKIPGTDTISAGGWSDLHPTLFLKSLGCENTIYITRINGETVFGQGVVRRLLGLSNPTWSRIDPKTPEVTRKNNNNGDPSDRESIWGRMYNIANPNSSFALSVAAADGVWCTDWDTLDIKKGYTQVLDHGYHSKLYIQNERSELLNNGRFDLPAVSDDNLLDGIHHYEKGWPSYVGCVPL